MNINLYSILNQILAQYGESVLNDPRRVSSLLADLAQESPKPQKNALVKCLEHGFVQVLKNAGEAERDNYKQQLAQRLHNEEGFDLGLCEETLDLLLAALFGMAQTVRESTMQAALTESTVQNQTTTKKNICSNCNNELLEGWQACPFCLTPIQSQSQTPSQAVPDYMVYIQGGTFWMGSDEYDRKKFECEDEIEHKVNLSPFYIGKYQVTNEEYEEIVAPSKRRKKDFDLPVTDVSWYDAVEYCNLLSKKEGLAPAYDIDKNRKDPNNLLTARDDPLKWLVTWDRKANGYRLPTEAEWECACKAGTTTPYNTGFLIYHHDASFEKLLPVGSFPPNPWGLYDMHGNGYEWCWDWYDDYTVKTETDPTGEVSGRYRVRRSSISLYHSRSAQRWRIEPMKREYMTFRLVRSAL